jgi:hypothetical protein
MYDPLVTGEFLTRICFDAVGLIEVEINLRFIKPSLE